MAGVMWGDFDAAVDEVKRTLLGLQPQEGFAVYGEYQLEPSTESTLPESADSTPSLTGSGWPMTMRVGLRLGSRTELKLTKTADNVSAHAADTALRWSAAIRTCRRQRALRPSGTAADSVALRPSGTAADSVALRPSGTAADSVRCGHPELAAIRAFRGAWHPLASPLSTT